MIRCAGTIVAFAVVGGACAEDSTDGPSILIDGRRVPTEVIDDEFCYRLDGEQRCISVDDLTVTLATLPGGAPWEPSGVVGDEPLVVHCSEIGDGELCP